MTRTLAQYISMGYMIEKGKPNEPLMMAKTMAYDEIERAMLGGASSAPVENKPGTYEKLMGLQMTARGQ